MLQPWQTGPVPQQTGSGLERLERNVVCQNVWELKDRDPGKITLLTIQWVCGAEGPMVAGACEASVNQWLMTSFLPCLYFISLIYVRPQNCCTTGLGKHFRESSQWDILVSSSIVLNTWWLYFLEAYLDSHLSLSPISWWKTEYSIFCWNIYTDNEITCICFLHIQVIQSYTSCFLP